MVTELVTLKLSKRIAKTFLVARLCSKFTTRCVIPMKWEDMPTGLATSVCIHKFNSSSRDSYEFRMTHQARRRLLQCCATWMGKGVNQQFHTETHCGY